MCPASLHCLGEQWLLGAGYLGIMLSYLNMGFVYHSCGCVMVFFLTHGVTLKPTQTCFNINCFESLSGCKI